MTFTAAASPPDVHQCSIWTSLISAAEAPDARLSAPAVITPAIRIERSFIGALPLGFLRRKRSGCRFQRPVATPNCSISGPPREPRTGPWTGMDVERFFLGVVFDGVSPEFAANAGLAIAPERKLWCPIHERVDPDSSGAHPAADAESGIDV